MDFFWLVLCGCGQRRAGLPIFPYDNARNPAWALRFSPAYSESPFASTLFNTDGLMPNRPYFPGCHNQSRRELSASGPRGQVFRPPGMLPYIGRPGASRRDRRCWIKLVASGASGLKRTDAGNLMGHQVASVPLPGATALGLLCAGDRSDPSPSSSCWILGGHPQNRSSAPSPRPICLSLT